MPKTWKEILVEKLPKFTKKQIFSFLIALGLIILFSLVPISFKSKIFECDKGTVKYGKIK